MTFPLQYAISCNHILPKVILAALAFLQIGYAQNGGESQREKEPDTLAAYAKRPVYKASIILSREYIPPAPYLSLRNKELDFRIAYSVRRHGKGSINLATVLTAGLYSYHWDGQRAEYNHESETDMLGYGMLEEHLNFDSKVGWTASIFAGGGLGRGVWMTDRQKEIYGPTEYKKIEGNGPIIAVGADISLMALTAEVRHLNVIKTGRGLTTVGAGMRFKRGSTFFLTAGTIAIVWVVVSVVVLVSIMGAWQ